MLYIFSEPPSCELLRHTFNHLVARVSDGVNRMTKTNDHFFVFHALADICFGFVRRFVALLDLQRHFIRPAVFWPAQCANRANNRGIHIRAGARNHPTGKGGGVKLVFGVQHQRDMHRLFPALRWLFAVQQMQEVTADGVVIGFRLDAFAVVAVVIPIKENRAKRRQQFVGNIRAPETVCPLFLAACSRARKHRCA